MKTKTRRLISMSLISGAVMLAMNNAYALTADDVICSGCVGTTDIANGAVNGNKIAVNSIGAGKLKLGAVTTPKLATGAVVTQKIAQGAVITGKLRNQAVTSSKLAENITLGDAATTGTLDIVDTLGRHKLQTTTNRLYVGDSGSDVDLVVYDTSAPVAGTLTERGALYFNASLAWLYLGNGSVTNPGGNGYIGLRSNTGVLETSISTTTASQPVTGNGFVKGWARINADGTIASCYRCNTSTLETRKIGTGAYEVDFTTVSTDISARPASVSLRTSGEIYYQPRGGDASSVFVATRNSSGTSLDKPFTLILY